MSHEARTIARHAGTVLVGQLAVMAFGVTDTVVSGRYSEGALAALSVGSAIFITVFVALMGMLQALLPIWAELHGADKTIEMGRSVRQSLYLWLVASAVGISVLLFPGALLRWTQVPQAMQVEVADYLKVLALALPGALLFRIFSTMNQSLGRPLLVTWLQLGSLALKLPLSVWFTFGGAGLAPLGVVGCAWATVAVYFAMAAFGLWLVRHQAHYRPYSLWRKPEPIDWAQMRGFARLGVPAGLAVMVEVTSFTLMALFIARLGTTAAAAHQIASNLTAVGYMAPLSLGIATTSRVSYWLGAGDARKARSACRTGVSMTLAAALVVAGAMSTWREAIASLYSDTPLVASAAAALLLATAAYHLADAMQTVFVFVLRSYRVTVAPLAIYCTLLWGGGLAGGYVLCYRGVGSMSPMNSPLAFWLAGAAALWVTALLFGLLLWHTLRRSR